MIPFLVLLALLPSFSLAQREVRGVNLTLDEGFGARYSALAGTYLGFTGDQTSFSPFSAALVDSKRSGLSFGHMSKFGLADYDHLNGAMPLSESAVIAMGLSRFAVRDIERILDPDAGHFETFTSQDIVFTTALARKWGGISAGGTLSVLFRELDQKALGMRGDLSLRMQLHPNFSSAVLFKGILPSSARWSSDEIEYDPTDVFIGFGLKLPSDYIYGSLALAYQTEGIFQERPKSESSLTGSRAFSPLDWLSTGNLGVEYSLNLGLVFRAGVPEWNRKMSKMRPSMGLGYKFQNWVGVDYSFHPHVELEETHRIAIHYWPRS